MSNPSFQRARQPEQKQQRRAAILAAAATLFADGGFDKITLSAIAREAGISKANVYRYFESKEEIFLHLSLEDNAAWVADLEIQLADVATCGDLEEVAGVLARSLSARPRLAALAAVTSSILEHNVSEQVVLAYKQAMLPLAIRLGNALHAAMPALSIEQAREFLLYLYVVQTGLWPLAHPAPVVQQVLARPELAVFCVSWERDLQRMLVVVLRGMTDPRPSPP